MGTINHPKEHKILKSDHFLKIISQQQAANAPRWKFWKLDLSLLFNKIICVMKYLWAVDQKIPFQIIKLFIPNYLSPSLDILLVVEYIMHRCNAMNK